VIVAGSLGSALCAADLHSHRSNTRAARVVGQSWPTNWDCHHNAELYGEALEAPTPKKKAH
jgi:hypothetical protein